MERCYTAALLVLLVDSCFGGMMFGYNRELSAKIKELENSVADLKLQLDNINHGNPSMNPEKRNFQTLDPFHGTNGLTLRAGPGDNVAFYAVLAEDVTLRKDQPLVFDTTTTNAGGFYNTRTGAFTVPVKGTYVFSLNIACDTGNYVEISINKGKGGRALFNSICKNKTPYEIHQNGGSTLAQLNVGDKIYVEMIWPDAAGTVTGRGLSSFSGFLLRATP